MIPDSDDNRDGPPGGERLDPRLALEISQAAAGRVIAFSSEVGRLSSVTWGIVWLLGYGVLWRSSANSGGDPPAWAFAVFFGLMAAGLVICTIAGIKAGGQLAGPSALAGALYGWSWFITFGVGMSVIGIIAGRYGLTGQVIAVLFNAVAAILAGTLYMAGAAVFKEPAMFVIGAVMIGLAPVGVGVGVPGGYLAMALAGGGVMLVYFALQTLRIRQLGRANRRPPRA
ncbi:MAG: hypothetical protein LBU05_02495 [Bifidobacteriaceae bacterium]|nr:hypothetical protein [Bifidobacteriaceae bacterium]